MAYPNYYYPVNYQPYQMQPTQMSGANQPQTTGFIRVPHEDVARNWNVPPGMSLTFIDENSPYCYIKTAGISQFDRPKFERYRLVKEDEPSQTREAPATKEQPGEYKNSSEPQYALKTDLEALQGHFKRLEDVVRKIQQGGVKDEPADE